MPRAVGPKTKAVPKSLPEAVALRKPPASKGMRANGTVFVKIPRPRNRQAQSQSMRLFEALYRKRLAAANRTHNPTKTSKLQCWQTRRMAAGFRAIPIIAMARAFAAGAILCIKRIS